MSRYKALTFKKSVSDFENCGLFIVAPPDMVLRFTMKQEIRRSGLPREAQRRLCARVDDLKIETRFISAFEWNVTPWHSEDEHQTLEAAKHVVNSIKEKGMGLLSWDIFVEAYVA